MHFLTGYFALLSIGVFVIVVWRGLLPRIGRAALVFGGAALVASWVVVPLITDGAYFNLSIFNQGTFWLNSYGAPQALGWLFTGQLFDYGRFPIVSLLVLLGAVVCLCRFRSDARARALLGLMALSIVLFSGREPFGFILNLLPGNADLYLSRYMMGIQLAGDMLAGVGLAWAGETAFRSRTRLATPSSTRSRRRRADGCSRADHASRPGSTALRTRPVTQQASACRSRTTRPTAQRSTCSSTTSMRGEAVEPTPACPGTGGSSTTSGRCPCTRTWRTTMSTSLASRCARRR